MSCDGDGDGGDRLGVVWWCVRDNLAGFYLFRSMSRVCLFFCFKNTSKKAVNYYVIITNKIKIMLKKEGNHLKTN